MLQFFIVIKFKCYIDMPYEYIKYIRIYIYIFLLRYNEVLEVIKILFKYLFDLYVICLYSSEELELNTKINVNDQCNILT
jgi:hypothetical protein